MAKALKAGQFGTVVATLSPKAVEENHLKTNKFVITFEVKESGATDYGNGTATTVRIYDERGVEPSYMNGTLWHCDTRYNKDLTEVMENFIENLYGDYVTDTTEMLYFHESKDSDEEGRKEISYERCLDILHGSYRYNDMMKDMLTIPNNIDCYYSRIYAQTADGMVCMAGLYNLLPMHNKYDDKGKRIG